NSLVGRSASMTIWPTSDKAVAALHRRMLRPSSTGRGQISSPNILAKYPGQISWPNILAKYLGITCVQPRAGRHAPHARVTGNGGSTKRAPSGLPAAESCPREPLRQTDEPG